MSACICIPTGVVSRKNLYACITLAASFQKTTFQSIPPPVAWLDYVPSKKQIYLHNHFINSKYIGACVHGHALGHKNIIF